MLGYRSSPGWWGITTLNRLISPDAGAILGKTVQYLLYAAQRVRATRLRHADLAYAGAGEFLADLRLVQESLAQALGQTVTDVTAQEILNNIEAMAAALQEQKPGRPITLEWLLDTHTRLLRATSLEQKAGRLRLVERTMKGDLAVDVYWLVRDEVVPVCFDFLTHLTRSAAHDNHSLLLGRRLRRPEDRDPNDLAWAHGPRMKSGRGPSMCPSGAFFAPTGP